ncbi:unnamed protein product [Euphydryas editha]|uniref:Uncharacterized protein n=1 Tax=Euphydryas editha TaxID=104508 RepID=A0AAU9UF37_EUPED|nr:unnamed protein product [Euphydryas editha]
MKFGMDKCAVIYIGGGRITSSEYMQLINSLSLKSLSEGETYKYLRMLETLGIDDGAVKQMVKERLFGHLKKVLNNFISSGSKVRVFNCWVMLFHRLYLRAAWWIND